MLTGAGACSAGDLPAASHAAGTLVRRTEFRPSQWPAVSDQFLDTLRGGFDVGHNLIVSFGMERSVTINGQVVSQVNFNLPDMTKITADTSKAISDALAAAGLIQNGPGNQVMNSGIAGTTAPLVIQNSLNNQTIGTRTVINTNVNSMSLFKASNFQLGLKDALQGALTSR